MTEKRDSRSSGVRHARQMAVEIIKSYFEAGPLRVEHQASGMSNFVFQMVHPEGEFIVRIAPSVDRLNTFIKEQWAIAQACEAGVPISRILQVGIHDERYPYTITESIRGREATFHPDRLHIVKEMGRYAAIINSIHTSGFGETFDWSSNLLSRNDTWQKYLESEFDLDGQIAALIEHEMIDNAKGKRIRATLTKSSAFTDSPRLNHGDIRLKNVIVDKKGRVVAILDWEKCVSNPAPLWELALALHDLTIDEKQIFLEGYGIEPRDIAELAPAMHALNILHYARDLEQLSNSKDRVHLEWIRSRISGTLDMFSV